MSKTRSTISGASPSVGSSSSSSFGRETRARAIASCCCSPPESLAPGRVPVALQHREALDDLPDVLVDALAVLADARSDLDVLADGQAREDAAALGDERDAAAQDLSGESPTID